MFEQQTFERKRRGEETFEANSFDETSSAEDFSPKFANPLLNRKSERLVVSGPHSRSSDSRTPADPRQRSLMLAALGLLMVALCFVLYRDRDFWFADGPQAEVNQPAQTAPVATPTAPPPAAEQPSDSSAVASTSLSAPPAPETRPEIRSKHHAIAARSSVNVDSRSLGAASDVTSPDSDPPPAIVSNRTALPPLDVEVVAGDNHRNIRPGSSSIRVDLQPGAKPQPATQPSAEIPSAPKSVNQAPETADAGTVTSNASERVQMSADTVEVVSHPVKPGYPTLARQMKVQGAVILRALIGRDGVIQDLHVVSGPRILASAAEDAVRQWHFKPHYVNDEAVETQAKITVNFTISTN